jgi:uncharacterized protein (TIGR02246 family)
VHRPDTFLNGTRTAGLAMLVSVIAAAGCVERGPGAGAESEAASAAGADSAAVVAVVLAHRTAIASGNADAVASQHRPDLTFFGPESRHLVTVASESPETAALWERFRGSSATWVPRDVHVQVFGDIAIAAFFIDGSATYADGTTDTRTRRVTEVWIRNAAGAWQEAHHHESPLEG